MQVEHSAIHPEYILPIWSKVGPLFDRLITEQGTDSLENMYNRFAINKSNLLWIAWEKDNLDNILIALDTRLREKTFEILGCVGRDRHLWLDYFSTLEQYAKDNKCNKIMIKNGRKGWQKDLAKQGMKVTGYTFEKKL